MPLDKAPDPRPVAEHCGVHPKARLHQTSSGCCSEGCDCDCPSCVAAREEEEKP